MFKEGKSRVDVVIALNLETFEIISLFHDYLKLYDIDKLVTVYDYLGSDLSIFLNLFDRMNDEGILTQPAIAMLVQSAEKLARLEEESLKVYGQIGRLNNKKFELEREV